MNNSRKVCEHSLKWIQAMRKNSQFHNYSLDLMIPTKYPEIFGDHNGDFGHSGGSFYWCVKQAKKIDSIGLDEWIKTDNALGYGVYFKNAFDKMFGGDRASLGPLSNCGDRASPDRESSTTKELQ